MEITATGEQTPQSKSASRPLHHMHDVDTEKAEREGSSPPEVSFGQAAKEEQSKGKQNKLRVPRKKDVNMRLAELGKRGTGFVKNVKEAGFGFINSPELDEQLFFHVSELIRPQGEEDKPFLDFISPGDEVEFVVGQNTGSRMNLVAQKVQKLAPNSVKAQILSEEYFQGRVSKELNSDNWRSEGSGPGRISFQNKANPGSIQEETIEFHKEDVFKLRQLLREGTPVHFYICTDNQTKTRKAVHVEVLKDGSGGGLQAETMLHGFIKDLSKTGGIIRCVEVDRRFSFRSSEVMYEPHTILAKGQPVMFTLITDQKGHEHVNSLSVLPDGALSAEIDLGFVQGKVVRVLPTEKERGSGLLITPQHPAAKVNFDADSSTACDLHSLEIDDEVEMRLLDNVQQDMRVAKEIKLLCKGKEKRELGQVRTKKSNFGFIVCCQRSGQLFFHSSAVLDCNFEDLKKGDDVEFCVERHPERGIMAVRLRKVPQGTAIFETISEATFKGHVSSPISIISQGVTTSGVINFTENRLPSKILYTANDFQEEVRIGDIVTFQIADNVKAAKQVESLGSIASRMVGRRATNGKIVKLNGVVKQILAGFGFISVVDPPGTPERRIYFRFNEIVDQIELKLGDEVSFIPTQGPKLKEEYARRIIRTKEAPVVQVREEPVKINPNKPVLQVAQQTVRTPLMPDGTRGFHIGRGGKSPTPPVLDAGPPDGEGNNTRVPGKLLKNNNNQMLEFPPGALHRNGMANNYINTSAQPRPDRKKGKKPKSAQNGAVPDPEPKNLPPTALLQPPIRSFSGRMLNPNAAEFQPRTSTPLNEIEPKAR